MDQMKVLFAFYPTHICYSLGIAQLSAICKERGIHVELCVLSALDKFRAFLKGKHYDYVCFSTITHLDAPRVRPFIEYAGIAGLNVLVGGTWAKWFDVPFPTCRGDGETIADFFLTGDDRLFLEELITHDLNALPLPDFEMFRNHPFDRGYGLATGTQLPYYSSRGCPQQCSFCLNVLQAGGVRIRTKVEEDLTILTEKYHPGTVFIGDAMLPYASDAWRRSWGEFRYPFFGYIRADIKKETLLWLLDRGMNQCAFGVESGDERYRNEVLKKNLSDDQLFATVDILNANGVKYVPFYMQYTPGETLEVRKKTYDMMDRVGGYPFITDYQELT